MFMCVSFCKTISIILFYFFQLKEHWFENYLDLVIKNG